MESNIFVKENGRESKTQIIRHPMYQASTKMSLSWFDIRVFYVRISNFLVDDLTLQSLTLNHIPLSPDTLLEINGVRCAIDSEGMSSLLRRDRVDKKSEEATFVSTDSIRFTGSVKFEVFDKDELVLYGVLEKPNTSGLNGEMKSSKRWNMNCESVMNVNGGFLKGKQVTSLESVSPIVEVYVAGSFSGTPIILSKSLQIGYRKKQNRKGMLDSIPEYDSVPEYDSQTENETSETQSNGDPGIDLQLARFRNYKPENEEEYNSMYWRRTDYMDGEDGEMSWFNAGVRVGVGIGLGVCLGVGIGVVTCAFSWRKGFRRKVSTATKLFMYLYYCTIM